jgi:cytochrome b
MSKLNITKLLLDLGAFAALLIVSAPHFTGGSVHEWLGIALSGAVVVHLLLNWNWIVQITSRLFSKPAKGQRFKYFLNWSLFASGVMIVLSGLMISKTVMPFLGLSGSQNMSWKQLHELFTNILMILMGLHVAVHWSWIVNMFKRLFAPRVAPRVVTPALSLRRKDAES